MLPVIAERRHYIEPLVLFGNVLNFNVILNNAYAIYRIPRISINDSTTLGKV